jgi:hypothetical protein
MALVPTEWTDQTFPEGPSGVPGIEGRGGVNVRSGYHRNPGRQDDTILIESTKTVLNEYGTQIRRDKEHWTYELHGAPPTKYVREVFSNVYLPGLGRFPDRPVEVETIYYWPFTPLTTGDNLGRTRIVDAYVVYDKPVKETPLTPEQVFEMIEAGTYPLETTDRIVQSGKLWSDANLTASIVPQQESAQITKWITGVIVEEELVEEEIDKWTIWNIKKYGLTSAGVEWSGPRHVRKTGHKYKLPVPVEPPKLDSDNIIGGIRLEMDGGGAVIATKNQYFHVRFFISPDRYHLYRRTVTEPERTPDDNLPPWWETPPAGSISTILENTAVLDEDGNPTSPLPVAVDYSEPEDPAPADPPPDTEFRRIATVDNTKPKGETGYAQHIDKDVEDTGVYEYYATVEIGDQESANSNHVRATYNGGGTRTYRMITLPDGSVDAIAPDDPALGDPDDGDVVEFDIPTTDPDPVVDDVAERAFTQKEPDVQMLVTVKVPVFGLEWGQGAVLPNIEWETFAPGYHISTETVPDRWMVSGFKRKAQRTADGKWSTPNTIVRLQQRPDPS